MHIPEQAKEPLIVGCDFPRKNVQGVSTEIHVRTAEQAAQHRDTVPMNFPHDVVLTEGPGGPIRFGAGVNPVPLELVDHWYLKANGATPVEGKDGDRG